MKIKMIALVLGLCMSSQLQAQTEGAQAPSDATTATDTTAKRKIMVGKYILPYNDRAILKENEELLTFKTSQAIENPAFKDFTILVGWYKQTKTHFYYQIGWLLDGEPVFQLMKYSWADETVSPATQEQVAADNDY